MKQLNGAQRILGSGDPKNLQAQLRKVLPIYSNISLEVVSADDILETKVPLSTDNMTHLGTMHAGITWMAAEVLGGLAYLGHSQDFGQAWAAVKGVEIEIKHPVTSGISAKAKLAASKLGEEVASGQIRHRLWAKAIAETGGDDAVGKDHYQKLRLEVMKAEVTDFAMTEAAKASEQREKQAA